MEQKREFIVVYVTLTLSKFPSIFSTVRGYNFRDRKRFNQMYRERRKPMFAVAVSICLLVFAVLAGANLLISNINSDELSNMGIEKKL